MTTVEWSKLFEIWKSLAIKYNDRRVILNVYKNQATMVGVAEVGATVRKDVRQGRSQYPFFFLKPV